MTTTLPEALTVECVLRPNRKPEDLQRLHVVGTRNSIDRDRRGYFLLINTSGKLALQVGNPAAVSFSDELETNHWYYVVTTFDVTASGATTQTVINAYFADLTAGGPLTHALANHTVSGFNARYSFNPSQIGIGCLWNADSVQYPSPASIDEVAIYGSVFSAETIDKHLEALRREMPEVWYREIFPSDNKLEHPSTEEGWFCHWDSTATTVPSTIVVPKADTAFLEDVSPVGSSPSGSGSSFGYLNNYSGRPPPTISTGPKK
ncbi:MAG: LamG-like jellyroll fold domain-containing protein [Kiritimatiellia bacterium]